jgi:hypothetical protein
MGKPAPRRRSSGFTVEIHGRIKIDITPRKVRRALAFMATIIALIIAAKSGSIMTLFV